jgi:hypothetical protein
VAKHKTHPRRRFTVKQIAQALQKSGGVYTGAAEVLSEASGKKCTYSTIKHYMKCFPQLEVVADLAVNTTLDLAESKLITQIEKGNLTAVIFYLKCKGKSRGYIDRVITEVKAGAVALEDVASVLAGAKEKSSQHKVSPPDLKVVKDAE